MKVRDWMLEHIASTHLFLAGLAVIPAFLFQKNLIVRAAVILLFIVLCLVSGKSVKPGYSLVILLTIALFSLLTPMGKVLFRVAGLPVTDRALLMGGYRGLTVVGLFYVLATLAALIGVAGAIYLRARYAIALYAVLLVVIWTVFHKLGMIRPKPRAASDHAGPSDPREG